MNLRLRTIAVLSLISLLVSACAEGNDGEPPNGASSIDTISGIVQVTNPASAPEEWRFEEVLTLGQLGGEGVGDPEVFGRITSIIADDEGNLYVADGQALEIRTFDREGTYLRSIGRSGQGPGEFGALTSLTWAADTLHALDWGNARIQRFTRDGSEAGTMGWHRLSNNYVRFYSTSDGRVHVLGLPRQIVDPQGEPGTAFLVYDQGALVDSIVVRFRSEMPATGVVCESSGGIEWVTNSYAPQRIALPAGDGQALYAITAVYRINFLDATGDTVRRIVRDGGGFRPLPDEAWEVVEDSVRALRSRQPMGSTCNPSELERPAGLPILVDLLYDQEGRLVVEVETDTGFAFDFHDDEDRLLARASAPSRDRRVRPYFRNGHLYVVTMGESDLPGVAVYRIIGP
jgi:hypothetical protein